MDHRFQVDPDQSPFRASRLLFLLLACLLVGLLEVAVWPAPGIWWRWPQGWGEVLRHAARLFPIVIVMLALDLWSGLMAVEVDERGITVHRHIQRLPLIGRFLGPKRFSGKEWRLAATSEGLLVGRISSDIEFRWKEERVYICPKASRPALKQWLSGLAQLG